MAYNFGLTAHDYAKYRAGFPDEFFERVFNERIVKAGDSLVDLGTGTGTLARGFASRGCKAIGVDIASQLLEQARDLSIQQELEVEFRFAKAEESGLPDSAFDVVSAGQCWHWFDRPRAAAEVMRLLKPNGKALIAHFDWLPLDDNVVDVTEKLIQKFNPAWYERFGNKTGIYSDWFRDLGEAGFESIESFTFDLDVPYTADAWRGRIRASSGVGASLSDEEVGRFDSELKSLLGVFEQAAVKPEAALQPVLNIPHRVFVVHARKPNSIL
ncbi:MAG: methyltransferase domain-containing protein [Anaerolineales bacterium]|nr:methyltransferase domain-containing protein [Anaerolineales bacterium]